MKRPKFQVVLFFTVLVIALGVIFYNKVENMGISDAFYFVVMTITTVGYGDIIPKTFWGKLFTSFYSIVGIGLMFAFITFLISYVQQEGAFAKETRNRRKKKKK
ncbi:potassium channel family protein [Patescibacteria group bacterium]|nr:potassium channel family protein [Patescibacteria group bacterium]